MPSRMASLERQIHLLKQFTVFMPGVAEVGDAAAAFEGHPAIILFNETDDHRTVEGLAVKKTENTGEPPPVISFCLGDHFHGLG